MKTRQLTGIVCAALVLLNPSARVMVQADTRQSVEDIRKELLQLPYYSVFDFLAFSYDRGTVVVGGYAYALGLKKDAERAVKRASGVDTVVNKIEELPPNQIDDQIRWATYYKIYRDPFLSRYAPGGGLLWGHRHAFGGPFSPYGGPFLEWSPRGTIRFTSSSKTGASHCLAWWIARTTRPSRDCGRVRSRERSTSRISSSSKEAASGLRNERHTTDGLDRTVEVSRRLRLVSAVRLRRGVAVSGWIVN
jgi:hypothetical protein